MQKTITPKLTLVGAGPGNAELISLKGLRAIKTANVILYDALASEEILEYASADTLLIYVGKSLGHYKYTQAQINELIVKYAYTYGHVLRLKGGDPFVFGRGFEELSYARQYGIDTEVVSGISSCISVPASIGIPVTHRGLAESFWVITGTTKTGELSADIKLAAKSNATIVILMGMSKLQQICEIFTEAGKAHTPVAVIQNGSRSNSRYAIANISNITDAVTENKLTNPAVIVIGEVVSLQQRFSAIMEHEFTTH
jgi:uroporphyrin-III C-methyltransferase